MQHINLDLEFESLKKNVISHSYFNLVTKHQQIRINSWVTKL